MEKKFLGCFEIIFCSIILLEGLQSLDLDHAKAIKDRLFQQQRDVRRLMVQEQGRKRLADSKRYVLDNNIDVYQPHMGNKRKEKFIFVS